MPQKKDDSSDRSDGKDQRPSRTWLGRARGRVAPQQDDDIVALLDDGVERSDLTTPSTHEVLTAVAEAPRAAVSSSAPLAPVDTESLYEKASPNKGLAEVLRQAYMLQVAENHEERRHREHTEAAKSRFWLNGKLMMAAVAERDGPSSWQAKMVRTLQSQDVQIGLIVLLLLDVIFIFTELFIEAEYPTCHTMSQRAVSCCPAVPLEARQLRDHFVVHDEANEKLAYQMGHFAECPSPFVAAPADNGLQCLNNDWAHAMHDWLTLGSLCILSIFLFELLALLAALGSLFLRSWAYILDLAIISSSLSIMLYVYLARAHGSAAGDVMALEELQGFVMLARCWRFVRVGHGIALSMHDLLQASHVQTQNRIDALRQALHVMEANHRMAGKGPTKAQDAGLDQMRSLLNEFGSSRNLG